MERNQSDLSRNERAVLQLLRTGGDQSMAELARRSGLGKATVSRLIGKLRDEGIVIETGDQLATGGRGRSGTALRLRADAEIWVGLHVRTGGLEVVVADAQRQTIHSETIPASYDSDLTARVALLADTVVRALDKACQPRDRLAGVAIAIAAPIHPVSKQVGPAVRFPEWHGDSVEGPLSATLGVPVMVENDSDCAALYEVAQGRLPPDASFAYVHLDKGVGGAVVIDGQVWRGLTGRAGSFGHMSHDPDGAYCRCGGRGCYEQFVSIPALLARIEPAFGPLGFDEVVGHVEEGHHAMARVVADTGAIVGQMLANLSRSIDPPMFLLGGQMVRLGAMFRDAVVETLTARNPGAGTVEITDLGGPDTRQATAFGAIALLITREVGA